SSGQDLDGATAVGDVRGGSDDCAADALRHARCDRVGPRAGHEHVAVELEERLPRAHRPRAILYEPVAVALTEGEKLLDVESLRIGQEAVDCAYADHARPCPGAGACRSGADL